MKTKMWKAQLRGCCFFGNSSCRKMLRLTVNQPILLVREPTNPADVNAVQTGDVLGDMFGYIQRDVAAEVAPIMDGGTIVMAKIICAAYLMNSNGRMRRWHVPEALLWTHEDEQEKEERKEVDNPIQKTIDKVEERIKELEKIK